MQVRNSLRRLLRLELLNIFLRALHRSELLEHPTADDDRRLETTLAGISDRSCRPGLFMIAAFAFGTILEHPSSPVRRLI
jgi:hypothetical protein